MLMLVQTHGAALSIHAVINLVAAACIAYYFMNKEGYISF